MKKPRISIIGLGRVGTTLLKALSLHNFQVVSVYNRSEISDQLAASFPKTSFHTGLPDDENELGELTFITISDDAIENVSEDMAKKMNSLIGKFFVHCSGTISSDILNGLKEKGGHIASFHPMKSITPKTDHFNNVWFDLEGDEAVLSMLENIADRINSYTFRVEPEDKALLHVSAVVASNYLVVLADLASSISAQGNIPKNIAMQALSSLMQNTLDNIGEMGVDDALTGPIARGDIKTVRDHLEKMQSDKGTLVLYKKLGLRALEIVKRKQELSPDHLEIKRLLSK